MRILLRILILVTSAMLVSASNMDTVYKWKYIDYSWESEAVRQQAIDRGIYNYTQITPMDVDKAQDGRVFVTLFGTAPASLGTVSNTYGPSGPLIQPYPDWSFYKKGDCNSISNVIRIAIDSCNRLWVLDTGDFQNPPVCGPQLLAFDLNTDRLIQRIEIPQKYARGKNGQSMLVTPIVETIGFACHDTTVYMADVQGYGLIIWNNGKFSRLESTAFQPAKSNEAMNITLGHLSVKWEDGIIGMALTPFRHPGHERFLYFRPMASFDLYAVSTEQLKNAKEGSVLTFYGVKSVLKSQALSIAFSDEETLFTGTIKDSAIACWSRYRQLIPANIGVAAQDNVRLQYTNGLKVIKGPNGKEELWVLSNKFVAYRFGILNFNEYNFYVLKSSVENLINGTVC